MGIRGRIVALASRAVALAVVAAVAGAYLAVRGELRGQADEALTEQAHLVSALVEHGPPDERRFRQRLDQAPPEVGPVVAPGGLLAQGITPEGELAPFPRADQPQPIESEDKAVASTGSGLEFSDRTIDGEHYRVATVGVGDEGAVMLARSLAGVDRALDNLRLVLAGLVAAGVALAGVLALLVARRVIAPITQLTQAAEHISETQDLSRRIAVDGDDEVARLAGRFDAMLDALEEHQQALGRSVESQRKLVADASHELRTPVAAIRTDIETLIAHPELSEAERTQILAAADERIEELTEIILDVIELARADEDEREADDDIRLDLIAAQSIERLERMSPGRKLEVEIEPSVVRGRPDRLYRAINNLLDNADKYSPRDEPIEVRVSGGRIEVGDRGPGIPAADLPHLFDRFWRGSTSRHRAGSGLGLAIVRQVAEAAGGEVAVENRVGGGASFSLRMPEGDLEREPILS